jgi:hypothetical protein
LASAEAATRYAESKPTFGVASHLVTIDEARKVVIARALFPKFGQTYKQMLR